jgi:hypothetical protein
MRKEERFNAVLKSAKKALDSIGVPFHLHAGTALGAHREHSFIKHDHDIDLAVFHHDANTAAKARKIEDAMLDHGFDVLNTLGTIKRGKEIQFEKNGIPLDIFWVYEGEYRGKQYHTVASYFGDCDKLPHKTCVWAYRRYKTVKVRFLGHEYNVVPTSTLVDMYGDDWRTPKKFGYYEGIQEGGYKGFIPDYYDPKSVDRKVAFCFLLYDKVTHRSSWEKFFNQDKFFEKSYSVYAHLKKTTDKTPEWIKSAAVKSVKTDWCDSSLVWAWLVMLREALKDPKNKYFCLLSGECLPLYNFWTTYKKITSSDRARVQLDNEAEVHQVTGLNYASQWCILTRETAKALLELKTTAKGKEFVRKIKSRMCTGPDECFCPDEVYPVNWFVYKYGKEGFRKRISTQMATYTRWEGDPHPIKFTSPKMKRFKSEICGSGAVFARKFNEKAGRELAMSC